MHFDHSAHCKGFMLKKKKNQKRLILEIKAASLSCSVEENPLFRLVSSEIINRLFLMADSTPLSGHSCRFGSNGEDAITSVGGRKMDG